MHVRGTVDQLGLGSRRPGAGVWVVVVQMLPAVFPPSWTPNFCYGSGTSCWAGMVIFRSLCDIVVVTENWVEPHGEGAAGSERLNAFLPSPVLGVSCRPVGAGCSPERVHASRAGLGGPLLLQPTGMATTWAWRSRPWSAPPGRAAEVPMGRVCVRVPGTFGPSPKATLFTSRKLRIVKPCS